MVGERPLTEEGETQERERGRETGKRQGHLYTDTHLAGTRDDIIGYWATEKQAGDIQCQLFTLQSY